MVEDIGHPVSMFEVSYENIKVTTAGDLVVAVAFLRGILGSLPIDKESYTIE